MPVLKQKQINKLIIKTAALYITLIKKTQKICYLHKDRHQCELTLK
jgi:hypothetical protein